jgi:hypothetical protein
MLAALATAATAAAADAANDKAAHQAALDALIPPAKLLDARERFDSLSSHLLQYGDYYRFHILMDRRASGEDLRPPTIASLGDSVDPTPVALINGKLAYQVNLDAMPGAADLLEKLLDVENMPPPSEAEQFTLPTPGLVIEPKLSNCSACEDFVEEGRKIELRLRHFQAEQARLEVERLRARLNHNPPILSDDATVIPPLTVNLVTEPPPNG